MQEKLLNFSTAFTNIHNVQKD